MKMIEIEAIKPGNPFLSDFSNMGIQLGTNIMAMMMNHPSEKMNWVVLVDMETGKRVRIDFDDEEHGKW
jgi:hypothetical protein